MSTPLVSDLIRETLGPDVQAAAWNGAIMPIDAVLERQQVWGHTVEWWEESHRNNTLYHQQYFGYCMFCTQEEES